MKKQNYKVLYMVIILIMVGVLNPNYTQAEGDYTLTIITQEENKIDGVVKTTLSQEVELENKPLEGVASKEGEKESLKDTIMRQLQKIIQKIKLWIIK